MSRTPPYFPSAEAARDAARRSWWQIVGSPADGSLAIDHETGQRYRLTIHASGGAHPWSWEPVTR